MTDYSDLVKRLRVGTTEKFRDGSSETVSTALEREAADAIEHLMKEIDVLDDHWRKDKKQIEALERIAQKQSDELNVLRGSIANYQVGVHEDRIAELEAALKPFADKAIYVDEIDYDFLVSVKAIDLRQASKVLGEKE